MTCNICNIKPRAKVRTVCFKCRSKKIREKDRIAFTWYMLRKSAKKRGITFYLPLPDFRNFVLETGFKPCTGRLSDSLTIDRKDGSIGYVINNLQVLKKSDNCKKYHDKDKEYEGIYTTADVPF